MSVKWLLTLALTAGIFCATGCLLAAENDAAFVSGLHPGDKLASFKCVGVTGQDKGKPLCYV